jgi:hypothetical protein
MYTCDKKEIKTPLKTEQEVMRGKNKERPVAFFKKRIYFSDLGKFFKKFMGWVFLALLILSGCCPHFMKCVP